MSGRVWSGSVRVRLVEFGVCFARRIKDRKEPPRRTSESPFNASPLMILKVTALISNVS